MYYYFWSYLPTFIRNNNPIKYLLIRYYWRVFLKKKPIKVKLFNDNKNEDIEIYIIAFNNDKLIENQIYFLRKNCLDNYKLIIADNSSDDEISNKIYNLCEKKHVDYIRLPKDNNLKLSWSHWYALNYLMKHFILKSKIPYFWFLDHDCFLVKNFSILKELEKTWIWWLIPCEQCIKIWKKVIGWYWGRRFLWPWCSFFDKTLFKKWYDFTLNKRMLPLSFLDTWWWNRKYVYKYLDKDSLNTLKISWDGKYEYLWDLFFHISGSWWRNGEKVDAWLKKLRLDYD